MPKDDAALLVVDDDPEIAAIIESYFVKTGFSVDVAGSARAAQALLSERHFDLAIIDLGLPDENGLSLISKLREQPRMGIIIITGRGGLADRVTGLELGADDYVSKPFEPRELLARVRSVLRRVPAPSPGSGAPAEPVRFDGWTLDFSGRRVLRPDGSEFPLTSAEFDLMAVFARNLNRVLSRDFLFQETRGRSLEPFDRSIDVLVSRLRRKLEAEPGRPAVIKTVHGTGYLFFVDTGAAEATPAAPSADKPA